MESHPDGMLMNDAVRTIRALAAFSPEASTKNLRETIAEMRTALDQLEGILTDD